MNAYPTMYFIWNTERGMWWRGNHRGYASNISEAGRYSSVNASDIVINAMLGWDGNGCPPEMMVPCAFEKAGIVAEPNEYF